MPVLLVGGVELVWLVVAVAAIVVLLAAYVLFQPIRYVFSKLPLVGGYVAGVVDRFLTDAIRAIAGAMDSSVHAVGHLIWAGSVGLWHLWYQTVRGIVQALQSAAHALTVAYQQGAAAIGWAQAAVNGALSAVRGWVNNAEAVAAGEVGAALNTAEGMVSQASAAADSLFATAEADIASVASDVVSEANTVLGEAEAFAAGLSDRVLSEANTLFGQAEAALEGAVAGIDSAVSGLAGQLSGLEGEVAGIAGTLGILAVIPALLSQVGALTTEADTCLKPLCDTVTPNAGQLGKMGRFLSGLETLGVDVVVAGLFAAAVADPVGLARETVTLVEDVGGPVVAGVRDMTGL